MHDDTIELIVDGFKDLRKELKEVREELIAVRLAMAYDRGQTKGRAGIFGAISGFASAVAVHVFGPAILSLFNFKK